MDADGKIHENQTNSTEKQEQKWNGMGDHSLEEFGSDTSSVDEKFMVASQSVSMGSCSKDRDETGIFFVEGIGNEDETAMKYSSAETQIHKDQDFFDSVAPNSSFRLQDKGSFLDSSESLSDDGSFNKNSTVLSWDKVLAPLCNLGKITANTIPGKHLEQYRGSFSFPRLVLIVGFVILFFISGACLVSWMRVRPGNDPISCSLEMITSRNESSQLDTQSCDSYPNDPFLSHVNLHYGLLLDRSRAAYDENGDQVNKASSSSHSFEWHDPKFDIESRLQKLESDNEMMLHRISKLEALLDELLEHKKPEPPVSQYLEHSHSYLDYGSMWNLNGQLTGKTERLSSLPSSSPIQDDNSRDAKSWYVSHSTGKNTEFKRRKRHIDSSKSIVNSCRVPKSRCFYVDATGKIHKSISS